jgi:phytoene dehydrogenase-like protein
MSLPNRTGKSSTGNSSTSQITVVGAGLAGLTAAITCAEAGANVSLLEAHSALGGRARSSDGSYKANFGPHVLYKDGPLWEWLLERKLLPRYAGFA